MSKQKIVNSERKRSFRFTGHWSLITDQSSRRGFTLVELLVVIAIIGLLASVVLASLSGTRGKGRDGQRIANIKQVQVALSLYYDQNGTYPAGNTYASLGSGVLSPNYISVLPTDPTSAGTYVYTYQSTDGQGSPSVCPAPGPCAGYLLRAQLETNNTALQNALNFTTTVGTVDGCQTASFKYCVSQ